MAPTGTSANRRRGRADSKFTRLDGAQSAFLHWQSEQIASRTYDAQFPELFGRTFCPVQNDVDPAMDAYTWASYTQAGMAVLLKSYAENLPRADVYAEETTTPIHGVGDSYAWTLQEIRKSARNQLNLDSRKAMAARRAIEVKIDNIIALGEPDAGLGGMLSNANALTFTVPPGGGGQTPWASKSPLEILSDMNNIVSFVPRSTGEVEKVNALILPRDQYTLVSTTPWGSVSDTTILEYFKKNNPGVQVALWPVLAGQGTGGTDRMVAYNRNPDKLAVIIPQEFEALAPEQKGLQFEVACHARTGGVVFYYPMSMAYGDGI